MTIALYYFIFIMIILAFLLIILIKLIRDAQNDELDALTENETSGLPGSSPLNFIHLFNLDQFTDTCMNQWSAYDYQFNPARSYHDDCLEMKSFV